MVCFHNHTKQYYSHDDHKYFTQLIFNYAYTQVALKRWLYKLSTWRVLKQSINIVQQSNHLICVSMYWFCLQYKQFLMSVVIVLYIMSNRPPHSFVLVSYFSLSDNLSLTSTQSDPLPALAHNQLLSAHVSFDVHNFIVIKSIAANNSYVLLRDSCQDWNLIIENNS